jgi:hypothetical protein
LGENLEIYFDLICYEKESVKRFLLEGKELNIVDGKASLQIKTTKPGKQKHKVDIEYFCPFNEKISKSKFDFEFEVIDNLN